MNANFKSLFVLLLISMLPTFSVGQNNIKFSDDWIKPEGGVYCTKQHGSKLFVGGTFHGVSYPVNNFALLDAVTAKPKPGWGNIVPNNTVACVLPDGNGGWIIGGSFDRISGSKRYRVARINPDGSLNSWAPAVGGPIFGMTISGNTLYIAGNFQTVGGQTRKRVAAFDLNTGALTQWNANVSDVVYQIYSYGGRVYIRGGFSSVNGVTRNGQACIDSATATLTAWQPGVHINDMAFSGGKVYGVYNSYAGSYKALITMDTMTGATVPYGSPNFSLSSPGSGKVSSILIHGGRVYVGGSFNLVGVGGRSIAAFDLSTGALVGNWNPGPFYSSYGGPVHAIAAYDTVIYVTGNFHQVGMQSRMMGAAFGESSGNLLNWDPLIANSGQYDPDLQGSSISGGTVAIWGTMSAVGHVPASSLMCYDLNNGDATVYNFQISNPAITCLETDGNTLYIGGPFTAIGGQNQKALAAMDLTTGQLIPFNANVIKTNASQNPAVNSIKIKDNALYVCGVFTSIGGQARSGIARINKTTTLPDSWNPVLTINNPSSSNVPSVNSMLFDDSLIYFGGNFNAVGGQIRNNAAAVRTDNATLSAWNPNVSLANGAVSINAMADGGQAIFLGGKFDQVGGQGRKNAAAVDRQGNVRNWYPSLSDEVVQLKLVGGKMLVLGRFDSVASVQRLLIARVDTIGGVCDSYYPFQSCINAHSARTLDIIGDHTYVGGIFGDVNGMYSRDNFVAFTECPSTPVIQVAGNSTFCSDAPSILYAKDSLSFSSSFGIQWQVDGNPIPGAIHAAYVPTISGNYSIAISGSSVCSTQTSLAKSITIKPQPTAAIAVSGPTTFCEGNSVSLSANAVAGYTYAWLNNGIKVGSSAVFVAKYPGNYMLAVKQNGCTDTTTSGVTVMVHALPVARLSPTGTLNICAGDSINFMANPSYPTFTYSWMNGTNPVGATSSGYAAKTNGTYKVTITDTNGCQSKISTGVKVKVQPVLTASITTVGSTTIALNGSVTLKASPGSGVSWQWLLNGNPIPGATAKQYVAGTGGNYEVKVSKNGCESISGPIIVNQLPVRQTYQQTLDGTIALSVYPNPASAQLTLNVSGLERVKALVQIVDAKGRIVFTTRMEESAIVIDISQFSAGIYLIRFIDRSGQTGVIRMTKE